MRTDFSAETLASPAGARANEILRACVHCGFCNATCPTYQLTGDELDGPRGRIYLIRELLETGNNLDRATRHLDRCLTCRACETTCPSGVAYGELVDIARETLGPQRAGMAGLWRRLLKWMVPYPGRLRSLTRLGMTFRWFVPRKLAKNLPARMDKVLKTHREPPQAKSDANDQGRFNRVILLNGCAQQVNAASTNQHLARLLADRGVEAITLDGEVCCGGLDLHLGDAERAKEFMRQNVDVLSPYVDGVDAVISTASGCGVTLKEYGRLLSDTDDDVAVADAVSAKVLDVSEYLIGSGMTFETARSERRVAFQSPCTLQHGQQITGVVEQLLSAAGYELTPVPDAHLCCGSAGTYSILQPELSEQLKTNKLAALNSGGPQLIATANVGCQTHLAADSDVGVVHWVELLK